MMYFIDLFDSGLELQDSGNGLFKLYRRKLVLFNRSSEGTEDWSFFAVHLGLNVLG